MKYMNNNSIKAACMAVLFTLVHKQPKKITLTDARRKDIVFALSMLWDCYNTGYKMNAEQYDKIAKFLDDEDIF